MIPIGFLKIIYENYLLSSFKIGGLGQEDQGIH